MATKKISTQGCEQGFYIENGDFINRSIAVKFAFRSGQCVDPQWGSELFSEDVW
jgi:hypothetical protein